MSHMELDREPERKAPRMATVVVFVAAFAIIVSWLGTYAVTNALVAAEVMPPWPTEADPRPRWMLSAFGGLFLSFTVIGTLFQIASYRQLKRIDAISEAEG